jgi:hypothetical protein
MEPRTADPTERKEQAVEDREAADLGTEREALPADDDDVQAHAADLGTEREAADLGTEREAADLGT